MNATPAAAVPSLDIMMPFYGSFELLRTAVESVLAQDDPEWRLVVIDDQYPDAAPGEWLRAIGDPRITVLRNPVNLGVSGNFRRSAELAAADRTVIMGCDDVMLPNYVSHVKSLATRFPDVAIIQPGVEVIDDTGAVTLPLADRVKSWYRIGGSKPAVYEGEQIAASLLRGDWTYFPSLCWSTAVLREHEFRVEMDVTLDLEMKLQIIAAGGRMLVDDEVCFQYRRHESSVSSWKASDGTRFAQEATVFGEAARDLGARGWRRAARAARRHTSSRLNAATKLPQALRSGDRAGLALIIRHVFGRTGQAG